MWWAGQARRPWHVAPFLDSGRSAGQVLGNLVFESAWPSAARRGPVLDELNVYLKKRGWWFFPHTRTRNIHVVINMHRDNPAPLRINAPITTRRYRSLKWRPEVILLPVVGDKVKRQHVSVWPRWEQSDWSNTYLTWDTWEIKRPHIRQLTD